VSHGSCDPTGTLADAIGQLSICELPPSTLHCCCAQGSLAHPPERAGTAPMRGSCCAQTSEHAHSHAHSSCCAQRSEHAHSHTHTHAHTHARIAPTTWLPEGLAHPPERAGHCPHEGQPNLGGEIDLLVVDGARHNVARAPRHSCLQPAESPAVCRCQFSLFSLLKSVYWMEDVHGYQAPGHSCLETAEGPAACRWHFNL